MANILLHPVMKQAIAQLLSRPAHAVLIAGPTGIGKLSLAEHVGAKLLGLSAASFANHPYLTRISPEPGKAISIDDIRSAQQHLTLKVPGYHGIARIVIIENSHQMTTEAQNALLKTLEEPPDDTAIIMTATSKDALLPTIQSRVRLLDATAPPVEALRQLLQSYTADEKDIETALMLSGNLPGLAVALVSSDKTHPLYEATIQARSLLQLKAYERLLLIDTLSKQKQLCIDTTFILGQMARMALQRTQATAAAAKRWQNILQVSYEAERLLKGNAQTKLVLMNLMLDL